MKLGLVFVMGASIAALGCGGSNDDGGSGTGGASGGGGTTGTSSGPGVVCGPAGVCDVGQTCCVSLVGEPHACSASSPCEGIASEYSCDGPEDCGGKPCCEDGKGGFTCSATEACEGNRRCHTNADCPSGKPCIPVTLADVPVDVCPP